MALIKKEAVNVKIENTTLLCLELLKNEQTNKMNRIVEMFIKTTPGTIWDAKRYQKRINLIKRKKEATINIIYSKYINE